MSMNSRNPAVKRLMREAKDLHVPTELFHAQPLEDNLFEWHFTIRGPADTEFDGGIYHGRILIPSEYPMKPPNIILMTPNGRFEVNRKICLSISGFHPESWRPAWSIRTALLALVGFMPTHGLGAIGSLEYPADERKKLAKLSVEWKCPTCGQLSNVLLPISDASAKDQAEAKELVKEISMVGEGNKDEKKDTEVQPAASSNTPAPSATPGTPQVPSSSSTAVPLPTSVAPPMSFQEWLSKVKNLPASDINQLVGSPQQATRTTTPNSAAEPSRSRTRRTSEPSVWREEWPSISAMIFLAVAIIVIAFRRQVIEIIQDL